METLLKVPKPLLLALALLAALVVGWGSLFLLLRPANAPVTASAPAPKPLQLEYLPVVVGAPVTGSERPLVTNVQIFDVDADGLADILYCEAQKNSVHW